MFLVAILLDRRTRRLLKQATATGTPLPPDHPLQYLVGGNMQVFLCRGLSTSFLTSRNKASKARYNIYLQRELPPHRLELVLRHELAHIQLRHLPFKAIASAGCLLQWWNPLIWLGFRAFCLDLELACDERVLLGLNPSQRADYAQTLLELASGKPLLDAPLCFGEADAAIRIKRALAWKAPGHLRQAVTWLLAAALLLFFYAAPVQRLSLADKELAWQVYTQNAFLDTQERQLGEDGILSPGQSVTAGWYRMEPVDNPQEPKADQVEVYFQLSDGSWLSTDYFWYTQTVLGGQRHLYLPMGSFKAVSAPDLTGCQPLS